MHPARFALLTLACSACQQHVPIKYTATPSGSHAAHPLGKDCPFDIVTMRPSGPFEEVGQLTFGSQTDTAYRGTNDPSEFRQAVAADVCALGGTVVVTDINNGGTIIRGAVLRKTE